MRKVLLAALALLWAASAAAQPPGLDGTRWKARYRKAGGLLPFSKPDQLSFEGGRFRDTECRSYGFEEGPYETGAAGGAMIWSAVQFNADGERTEWHGELLGERMEGTLLWLRPDGDRRLYKFTATREEQTRIGPD